MLSEKAAGVWFFTLIKYRRKVPDDRFRVLRQLINRKENTGIITVCLCKKT